MQVQHNIVFDRTYYERIIKTYDYNPLDFDQINFSLGALDREDIQRRWLCHHNGDKIAQSFANGENSIVTTGFGLSGTPHAGTLSQILRAMTLQKAGIPVQIVLGDLDAYNGKARPLTETLHLVDKYREFIHRLGFESDGRSIVRSQYEATDVLRTAYIIGHYMDDEMFTAAEEDLHHIYSREGKVDAAMSYRRKLSLNLMIADFIDLKSKGKDNVLVMLGIDEHQYVRFGMETVRRMREDENASMDRFSIGALYTPLIRGFYNFPKMSKSFPDSGIHVAMKPEEVRQRIIEGEGSSDMPENNVIYQMMAAASTYSAKDISRLYDACAERSGAWERAKREYAEHLIEICQKWE